MKSLIPETQSIAGGSQGNPHSPIVPSSASRRRSLGAGTGWDFQRCFEVDKLDACS
ncbi:hypothetical protein P3T40_006871 [Paraburkholderia sp. EB58]|jgi:hypothetical protein